MLCLSLYLSSCAYKPPGIVQPPKSAVITASWYGQKFHGRPTASGEKFNMYAMTCAHKRFPFGTRLRVTYLKTGKSVDVKVNDRGPFIRGRDLDLSYAAAREIGLIAQGVGRVRIQSLGRDTSYVKEVGPRGSIPAHGTYTIQVGSFRDESNARYFQKGLRIKYKDVYIVPVYLNDKKFYRVRIGTFKNKDRAYSFAEALAKEGYNAFITGKQM
jgi:rare lipoprotein A